jgi:hypothetical protein
LPISNLGLLIRSKRHNNLGKFGDVGD